MKRIGVVFATSPWQSVDVAAGIDAALAALAFEHEVEVACVGAGVGVLSAGAGEGDRDQRARMISALLHHGATRVLASSECLAARGVHGALADAEIVSLADIGAWLREVDHVLAF